jgi:hypothetical protein
MAISTLDGWIESAKQRVTFVKMLATRSGAVGVFQNILDLIGRPGPGVLAGTDTAAGVVPTHATAGFPLINAFGGGATGYLSSVTCWGSLGTRFELMDLLFKAGAYSFNASTTLASQPSYAGRIPGGTDYSDTEIWFDGVTQFTGNPTLTVTYTNQAGTTGRTTGAIAFGFAPAVGRMHPLPLQAGDVGVQKIESVTMTVATVGTFNILVTRRLWSGKIPGAFASASADLLNTGMPEVFEDSALFLGVASDTGVTPVFDLSAVIVNK